MDWDPREVAMDGMFCGAAGMATDGYFCDAPPGVFHGGVPSELPARKRRHEQDVQDLSDIISVMREFDFL